MGLSGGFAKNVSDIYENLLVFIKEKIHWLSNLDGTRYSAVIDGMYLLYGIAQQARLSTQNDERTAATLQDVKRQLVNLIRDVAKANNVVAVTVLFDNDTPSLKNKGNLSRDKKIVPSSTPEYKNLDPESCWRKFIKENAPTVPRTIGGEVVLETAIELTPANMRNRDFKKFLISEMCDGFRESRTSFRSQAQNSLRVCIRGHGSNNFELEMADGEVSLAKEITLYTGWYQEAEMAISGVILEQKLLFRDSGTKFLVVCNDGDAWGPLITIMPHLFHGVTRHCENEVFWSMGGNRFDMAKWSLNEQNACAKYTQRMYNFKFSLVNYSIVILCGKNDYIDGLPSITVQSGLQGFIKSDPNLVSQIYRKLIKYPRDIKQGLNKVSLLKIRKGFFFLLVKLLYSSKKAASLVDGAIHWNTPNKSEVIVSSGALLRRMILLEWYLRYLIAGVYGYKDWYPEIPKELPDEDSYEDLKKPAEMIAAAPQKLTSALRKETPAEAVSFPIPKKVERPSVTFKDLDDISDMPSNVKKSGQEGAKPEKKAKKKKEGKSDKKSKSEKKRKSDKSEGKRKKKRRTEE
jgi:hypothetical protein